MKLSSIKFTSKRIVAIAFALTILFCSVIGMHLTASAMPDFDLDAIQEYANYSFHEVAETPLVDLSFEDMANADSAIKNSGSVGGEAVLNNTAGGKMIKARWGTGKALELTEADNYLSLPDLGKLDTMTFATWVKIRDISDRSDTSVPRVTTLLDTAAGTGRVVLKLVHVGDLEGTDDASLYSNTKLVLAIQDNAGGNYNENGVYANNEHWTEYEYTYAEEVGGWMTHMEAHCWVHIAFVYDPANKAVTFYTNGKLDSTKYFTTAVEPVLNGIRVGAGYTANEYYEGAVDDLRIYDKALSAEDVEALADYERDMWAYTTGDWEESTTTLYVDAANGHDSNPGTKNQPFATVSKGIASIKSAGTRLVIAPGVYHDVNMSLNASGTSTQPIIIEAEVPGETIIKGSSYLSDWKITTMENVYVHDWDYVFPITSAPGNDFLMRSEMLYVDGEPVQPVLSKEALKLNSYYLDEKRGKVYYMTQKLLGTFEVEVPDLGVTDSKNAYSLTTNSNDYLVLRGLTFTQVGTGLVDCSMIRLGHTKHLLVEDCVFTNAAGGGMNADSAWTNDDNFPEDYVIRRCTFNKLGGGSFGAGFRAMNIVIENCQFTNNGWKFEWGEYASPDPATMKMMFTKNITIRRNYFSNNSVNDVWFDNWNWNIDIDGNAFYGNKANIDVHIEINPVGVRVRNNTLTGGIHIANVDGMIVDNNVLYSKNDPLFSNWAWDFRFNTGKDTILTNNLFGFGKEGMTVLDSPPFEAFYDNMNASGNKFYIEGGSAEDKVFQVVGQMENYYGLIEAMGDESAEFLTENPFLDDGTATISFMDAASVSAGEGMANYIPVALSKPLRKEVSVSYTIWDYDTGKEIGSGVLEFGQFERQKDIYIGDGNQNILVELTGAKDILLGEYTLHYQAETN